MNATVPAAGPPRDAVLPQPVERVLDNGLRVVAFTQRALPLVAAQLIVRCGGAAETEGEAGLSAMVSALLTAGTARASASEIATEADALGARLDAASGYDASLVSVSATTPAFPQAFALLSEIVRTPAFADAEIERVRAKSLSDLTLTYANPSALARLAAQRVAYGDAPYGHPLAGTPRTLAGLTRARVEWFHERFYRPDDAVLVIGGDLDVDEAFALAARVLGDWRAPAAPMPPRPAGTIPAPRARTVIIDKPDAGRTCLVAGRVAIERASPDFDVAVIASAVLNGYSGRLNQEIRVKRGLSYGAGASIAARRMPGIFVASTLVDHARAAEAAEVTLTTIASLADAPATADDLATRKAVVLGGYHRGIETVEGIAAAIAELVLYETPLAELAAFPKRVQAVQPAEVADFARRVLIPDDFLVLCGDASRFGADIARARGAVETIPAAALDLSRPDLMEPS